MLKILFVGVLVIGSSAHSKTSDSITCFRDNGSSKVFTLMSQCPSSWPHASRPKESGKKVSERLCLDAAGGWVPASSGNCIGPAIEFDNKDSTAPEHVHVPESPSTEGV